jgi:hypothetical protein
MKIWTRRAAPFRLGGTTELIATEVTGEPFSFASFIGYNFHAFRNPISGAYHVAEAESGALVGFHEDSAARALSQVMNDVADGDPEYMRKQVEDGKRERDAATVLTPDEFWRGLAK